MRPQSALLCCLLPLLGLPMLAQTTIGEGTCSSSTLSGNYAVSLSGRGVTFPALLGAVIDTPARPVTNPEAVTASAGLVSNVLVAVGTANFDGLSKVTFTMMQDTAISTNIALNWSGTYSVQSNCVGAVNITTGDTATFNLAISLGGTGFVMTGSDPTYVYDATGNTQATGCSTSTLSGVYVVSATQGFYALEKSGAGGAGALSGLIQFDGQGNVTADVSLSANALSAGVTGTLSGLTAAGTYTLGSNCVGSATVTNPLAGALVVNFSVYTANSTTSTQMYLVIGSNPSQAMGVGNAYWIYASPSTPVATADGSAKREGGDAQ